ncbi:MAG TPA: spore coat protein U domain-containing protein [Rhodanobacteraceae bacterium]|nr:spore coat protein U domain-containing protein [Rhodanobacteraceae bacterium]
MNHTLLRCCAALLLIGFGLFWHKPAQAAVVTCTATMSNVNFNGVDPQSSQTDITGTLNYSCTDIDNNPQTVSLCFNLLGQNTDPRLMNDGNGDTLKFQLYTDTARTQVWGNSGFGTQAQGFLLQIPSGGNAQGTTTIYARVLGGQTAAVTGNYIDTFPAGQTTFTFTTHNGGGTPPPSCAASGTPGTFNGFTVTANVTAQCTVNASTLDFGPVGLLTAAIGQSSTVSVQCATGIAYNVGLDGGQNSGGNINARKMVLGANSVAYQLYRDSGRTQVWGNTVATNTVAGTGTGSAQPFTVYGNVPAQTTPPAGTYQDTVIVSVTY